MRFHIPLGRRVQWRESEREMGQGKRSGYGGVGEVLGEWGCGGSGRETLNGTDFA